MMYKITKTILRTLALALTICATCRASAVVKPIAVWNRDFPSSGNSATRGDITLDLNGNTSDGAAITITSSANGGVRLMNSSHPYGEVTALVAIKTNDVNFASQPVFGTGRRWVSNNDTRNNDCGTYITSTGYQHGFHSNNTDWKTAADVAWPSGIGLNYAAFHYQTEKNYGSRGTYAYYTTPTGYSTSYDNKNNLVNGDVATLYGVTIGGCYNKTDTTLSIGQMAGAEIQFIALFASTYADQSTYASPSELQKWSLTDMTSALTPVSGDTLSAANNATLVHKGVNLPTGGYITIDGDVTVAALFAQGNSEIRFADSDSSLTINGVVYVAGSNTLTINASAFNDLPGESESSVTYDALLCSNIAGTIAITEPTVADGYLVEKVVDTTGYHVVIAKGANYDETITGSNNWSSEKPEDWLDGSSPTITITVENGTTAGFTFDEAVQAGTVAIHCDGNLTLTMGANVTFSTLVIDGSGNVTLAKSDSPTISVGAYDFSSCTGSVILGYVITPSTVTGDVTLGLAYGSETSFPAFTGDVTVGTSMNVGNYDDVARSVTIPTGMSLTSSGQISLLAEKGSHSYVVDGGELSATTWYVSGDNVNTSLEVKNGGTATFSGTSTINWYITSVIPTYNITGVGSKLSFGSITARMWNSNNRQRINVSDGASIEFGSSITVYNSVPADKTYGYDIYLTGSTIGSTGAWSTDKSKLSHDSSVKIQLSGANTFDTSTYDVTYNHQITDQNAGTPGSITKTGTGKLTLTAASPAMGTFTVSEGELAFTTGSWAGSVDVTAGTLTVPGASAVIAGNVTVRSGAILSITTERPFMNVCSGTLTLESGAVVKVNGATVASPAVVDGSIVNSGVTAVWDAGTSGEWDTGANWLSGATPSAENAVVLRTANATITVSASSTAGDVYVDESTTIAGTAAALQSFAANVTSITIASGKTLTLSCTDDGAYDFNKAIGGDGALAVSHGTVTFKQANTFKGGLTVKQGGTLVKGDGVNRFGPDGKSVTIEVGGTLDLNKTSVSGTGISYAITIVEGDSSVWETTPVLTNTGDSLGTGWKQTASITVMANATIECNSNHDWGLLASGYGPSSLKIGKGKTLRKVGGGEFWLTNVTLSNLDGDSGSGDAVLKIVAGSANVINQGPSYSNSLSSGALFKVEVVGGSLEVNKNFTISALSHQGGSVNIAADKTLTVPSINVAANATMSPSGTIACNGDMTIGGTVTVPADKTWRFGSSDNDTSVNAGRISVVSGGTLVINGCVENRNKYGSAFNGLSIEDGGTVQVSATGTLKNLDATSYSWYNINCQTMISGNLEILGNWHNYGIVTVGSTGKLSVADTRKVTNVNSAILNYGLVEMTRWGYLTFSGSYVENNDSGCVVYAPDDNNVGQSIDPVTQYIKFASGTPATVLFDVSNLTSLPSGTSALTLLTTSTSLTLTADSLTGCSADYYVKQDGTTGAVTLQLHAAKDSAGVYYDDIEDAFDAIVADHTLSVTILDGTEANYATELAENGLFVSGTQVSFLAAEVKDGMGVLDPVPYASVSDAINAAKNSMKYVVAYESITMSADFSSVYIECAGGVSITLNHTSGEYQYASTLAVGSIYQYTATPKAADYTWNGETDGWGVPSNWLFAGDEAARYPRISGDTATFNDDASLELGTAISIGQLNVGSATVSFTAAGSAIESGESVNFTTANGIVLTDVDATLRVRSVNLTPAPTTSIAGKYVKSETADGWTTYTVADSRATVYDAEDNEVGCYGTVADAISAAANGQKVKLFANSSDNVTLNGKSITLIEDSYTFSGTFTGNGTLVLPDGTLLKSPSPDRWASGWTGTVWIRNYTSLTGKSIQNGTTYGSTSFEPNDYGNINSTVKFTGVKGYFRANNVENYTIQPALELEDDGEKPGLLLYNGWGYNSNVQCYTSIRELKGSGTLEADNTTPASSVLLQVLKWDNFTGTLTLPKKTVAFGSTLPVQTEVDGGGCVAVQSGASVEVPAGKTWTVGSGVVVYGNLSLGTGAAIVNTTAANTWIKCGTGMVTLNALADLPATPANDWTGTVVLPSLTASSGWSLNQYGNSGSTVEILGITGGWISEAGKAVAPKLKLTGDIVIGAMSSWTYSFSEITGGGNLSFATTGNQPSSVTISKVAEGYTGTISSTLTSTSVTIGKRNLSTLPACDDKVLAVGGTGQISLDVSNIKIGVNEESLPAKYKVERRVGEKGDGFYVYYNGTIFSVY